MTGRGRRVRWYLNRSRFTPFHIRIVEKIVFKDTFGAYAFWLNSQIVNGADFIEMLLGTCSKHENMLLPGRANSEDWWNEIFVESRYAEANFHHPYFDWLWITKQYSDDIWVRQRIVILFEQHVTLLADRWPIILGGTLFRDLLSKWAAFWEQSLCITNSGKPISSHITGCRPRRNRGS